MERAWALARPKTFSVGSPAMTSRKWPASFWSERMRAAVRSRVVAPTSAMKRGISGRLTAISDRTDPVGAGDDTDDRDGDDHGEEELRQVASEVAVEGVDARGHEHTELPRVASLESGGPERGERAARGTAQL